jgi:hypothetical protein
MILSTSDAHSVSDMEKGDPHTENDSVRDGIPIKSQGVVPTHLPVAGIDGKGLSSSTMNVSDWNGPDDPDNPHNCV